MYKLFDSSNVGEENFICTSLESRYENEFIKTAAKREFPKEVDEAIKNLARKKDHSYLLTTAMGDGETWGNNKNGDYFPYDGLLGKQNTPVSFLGKVWHPGKDERVNEKMEVKKRFQTFEDAHFFHHHRNKIEANPSFGYVPHAFWYPKMRTVLLIIGVDRTKDPETAGMIDRNELLAVSMGAKLPFDVCTYCGSTHKTIMQYCPHLKLMMNKIMPNGVRVGAANLFPRFFDISKVLRPAFLAGMQLEKVASVQGGELSVDLADRYDLGSFDKMADSEKTAVLYKELPLHVEGAIAKVSNTEQDLPLSLLNDLAKLSPQQAWGALTQAGIIAKPNEFAYILLKHDGHDELAEKFIKSKAVVNKPDVKGLDISVQNLASVAVDHTAKKIADSIPDNILNERSIGNLNERIYNTEKGLRKEAEAVRTIGLGAILSSLYMLYRQNAESQFNAYGLLGAGISQVIRDKDKADKYIGNDSFTTDQMNKNAAAAPGFWKSGKGIFLRGAAGFAAPYILSAHYQNKMYNGEQVGTVGRFIANNPGKLGIIGGAAAMNPQAIYTGAKKVGSDLANGINKLRKVKPIE